MKRILVDTNNFMDILTTKAFYHIGFKDAQLKLASPVYDFANQPIMVKRFIILPMVLKDGEHTNTKMVDFLVVDHLMAYNAIFKRPIMRKIKMVVATFYMMAKFPTFMGEGYMKVDWKTTLKCHIVSI